MNVTRIYLKEIYDDTRQYDSIVNFEKPTPLNDIQALVYMVRNKDDYAYDDIVNALSSVFSVKEIIDLHSAEVIEY